MVAKVILLLVYLYGNPMELKVEQKPFDTGEQCEAAGEQRAQQLVADDKFVAGILAACVPATVTEAAAK